MHGGKPKQPPSPPPSFVAVEVGVAAAPSETGTLADSSLPRLLLDLGHQGSRCRRWGDIALEFHGRIGREVGAGLLPP